MPAHTPRNETAAVQLLKQMKREGIDHLLANAGTDFPSVVEALAQPEHAQELPKAMAIHHESVAVAMAHGYHLASGRTAAVMVHVNVGLANCAMGALNAAAAQVPMLLMSGRTPMTEQGHHGSRLLPIHWGQEMFDQAALVREATKWTYELHHPEQAATAVHRAMSVAQAAPAGPVYLSLPREVLAQAITHALPTPEPVQHHPSPANPQAIAQAAALLAQAQCPVVIVQRTPCGGAIAGLADLARDLGLGVCEFWPTTNALATDHPSHIGFDPSAVLKDADVVLTLGALVPWAPAQALAADARVIAVGEDALETGSPYRGFPAHVLIHADPGLTLSALAEALQGQTSEALIKARQQRLAAMRSAQRESIEQQIQAAAQGPINHAFISRVLSEEAGPEALFISELGAVGAAMDLRAGQLFWTPLAGGLGWGVPAAMGAKLARREATVIATVGDGSYLFANPSACHQCAQAHGLPVLTVIFNNGRWQAVKRATLSMYPDGDAAASEPMPLTELGPSPDYSAVARAHGAYAEAVDSAEQLRPALRRALAALREGRQALLDVSMP
jgi:acetolactate synthase-1/2/3 large subunit